MPTKQKQETIHELTALLDRSSIAIVTDYRGIRVSEMGTIRRRLRESNSEFHVAKNTLARIAGQSLGQAAISDLLAGPTAIAFGMDDPVATAKVLQEYIRTTPRTLLKIKGALLDGQALSAEAVSELATLPPKIDILAQVLGAIQGPAAAIIGALQGSAMQLMLLLQARVQQLEEQGHTPAAAGLEESMAAKIDELIETIKGMTILEAAELAKRLQDDLGITAIAAAAPAAAAPAAAAAPVEEQTEFDVILTGFGDNKINVIKVVREITGLGLKEAKDLVEAAPKAIKEGIAKDEAAALKAKLEAGGASVEVK